MPGNTNGIYVVLIVTIIIPSQSLCLVMPMHKILCFLKDVYTFLADLNVWVLLKCLGFAQTLKSSDA